MSRRGGEGARGREGEPDGDSSPHPLAPSPTGSLSHSLPLLLVLLLAALLRFQGLAWGLPNAHHWFSYHPDEILVLGAADRVNLFAGRWDPGFYNYGSFLIYLVSVMSDIIAAWAPLPAQAPPYLLIARLTLIGRAWVALFAVATVYVVYLIGRRLGGERAGLLSAIVLAVLPMQAVHSHFTTVDVPATFWISVALYNALRFPERRSALWCGLAAGLAAGTKYNAGLVLLAGWAAAGLARDVTKAARWRAAGVMTGATALAFLVSTPGILFAPGAFWRDFGYETQHVRTGHGLVFEGTGPGWWYHLSVNLWQGLGAFLPLAALVALAVVLWRRRTAPSPSRPVAPSLILLAFALPYFSLISLAAVRFQRYDIPLLPVLAAGAGALFSRLNRRWMLVPAAGLLGTLALAQGMVSTMSAPQGVIQMFQPVFRTDPRDDVAAWMLPRLKPGASIGLVQEPWFYSPALTVANGGPQSRPLFEETRASLPYRLVLPEAENRTAFAPWPDFVVMSDYEYGDALRLQGVPVPERIAHIRPVPVRKTSPPEAQRLTRLWNNVLERYQVVGVWSPTPHVLGLRWSKRRLPPHDAFYSYPTIIVFVRKSG